ncbi:hypothetical protein [Thalassobius sp. Cn5-15]|uniref:hypothetical protein n=1 Tax=Thalassobius sp. Cn5-15 TaxID=2917763 RepID=UPI001EF34BEA|nr:hypothetical protein [Thalassobius sp. Cn5-15]MCG7493056.1 hypothetical protein [Thalassobius sp. Cn5-15]
MSDWNIPEYQELEDFAWDRMEVDDLRGATDAALRAIKLEPDTIDSYVILAQAAAVLGQKQAYAREAVRLGEIEFKDEIASAPSVSEFQGVSHCFDVAAHYTHQFMNVLIAGSARFARVGMPLAMMPSNTLLTS